MQTPTNPTLLHRRQVRRQIMLPFGIGVLLIAAIAVALGQVGLGPAGPWADIGLVWLTLLAMVAGLVILAVLVAAIAASVWVVRWIPPRASRLQVLIRRVTAGVERGADALVRPVIVVRSVGRVISRLWDRGEI